MFELNHSLVHNGCNSFTITPESLVNLNKFLKPSELQMGSALSAN